MGQKVTLGGERLGAGKKQKVELHGYERSTHDLGYLWRNTQAVGTLVPFLCEVALPGDTFDISLGCDIKTHPTIGPLFGSMKVQLDIFQCPIRLYQGQLHNNKLGIGMNMANVKLPLMRLQAIKVALSDQDLDNYQINPSCLLAYLGIRGVAYVPPGDTDTVGTRQFNAIPLIAYWDIYKQYYANKQEEIGTVIHNEVVAQTETVTAITVEGDAIPLAPGTPALKNAANGSLFNIAYSGTPPVLSQIVFRTSIGDLSAQDIANPYSINTVAGPAIEFTFNGNKYGNILINQWTYASIAPQVVLPPTLVTFPLSQIDDMREKILTFATSGATPFIINDDATGLEPYSLLLENVVSTRASYQNTQEGLAIKTYQSDLFNNWLNTEWIDDISAMSAVSTAGDEFTIDALNLAKKVYDMFNRIAVSGGTYDDWLDVNYDHDRIQRAESPIYHGGLSKELVFQEVISNSANNPADSGQPGQPLGTLAGRGTLTSKHKGGQVTIKIDEPSYIMGIISITPRLDYSQGNKWDINLQTMDDLHKPALDEIGFQELITEQMHWITTTKNSGVNTYNQGSAGKQPAWINYMTNVNQVRGNFAIQNNEMFMVLTRRYESNGGEIDDLTTYIDPIKFNHIFAQTSLDAMNYWVQVAIDMTARRKMSAKVMPNL